MSETYERLMALYAARQRDSALGFPITSPGGVAEARAAIDAQFRALLDALGHMVDAYMRAVGVREEDDPDLAFAIALLRKHGRLA